MAVLLQIGVSQHLRTNSMSYVCFDKTHCVKWLEWPPDLLRCLSTSSTSVWRWKVVYRLSVVQVCPSNKCFNSIQKGFPRCALRHTTSLRRYVSLPCDLRLGLHSMNLSTLWALTWLYAAWLSPENWNYSAHSLRKGNLSTKWVCKMSINL